MKVIKIGERDVKVTESWSEISILNCIDMMELLGKKDEMIEEIFLIKFIEIITDLTEDEILSLYEDDLAQFVEYINNFKDVSKLKKEDCKTFELGGRTYCVVIPTKLTLGENISIKLLEKANKNIYDSWLNILSILIRPGIEKQDELGNTYYEPEPFKSDIEVLNMRKELIKQIPAVHALWIVEAFTAGRE